MTFVKGDEKNLNIPFCAYEGLNYSGVIKDVHNAVSMHEIEKNELNPYVTAYNLDYSTLIKDKDAATFGVDFGEVKPLIEWFIKLPII